MVPDGAENIELWGAKPHFCVDDQNRESVREFRKRVEDKGLSLICFCPALRISQESALYIISIPASTYISSWSEDDS